MDLLSESVLSDFKASKKEINRLFFGGLIFALFVQIYIVEPYFQFKHEEVALASSLASMESSVAELSKKAARIRKTAEGVKVALSDIRSRLEAFPSHLRRSLPAIQEAVRLRTTDGRQGRQELGSGPSVSPTVQQLSPGISRSTAIPPLPPGVTNYEEAVRWYINQWFEDLLNRLENEVVAPFSRLSREQEGLDTKGLENECQRAITEVREFVSSIHPDFWHHYGGPRGKVEVAQDIRKKIDDAFIPIEEKAYILLERTRELQASREKELKSRQQRLKETRNRVESLGKRIETLESPFGRIPLDLTNLMKLFPFILVALALIMALSLQQAARRKAILQILLGGYRRELPVAVIDYQQEAWFLPGKRSYLPKLAIAGWMIAISAVFLRAVWLIANTPHLFHSTEVEIQAMTLKLFLLFCALGAGLLLVSSWLSLKKGHGFHFHPSP